MKKLLFLFLFTPFAIMGNEINPKLDIQSVIVYLNGAQLTSTTNFSLPEGTSKVEFVGLTPNIDANSIQINGLGNVTISAINFEVDYLETKEKTAQIEEIEMRVDAQSRKLALLRNKLSGLQEEESLLKTNKLINNQQQSSSLEKLKLYADYYRKRIAEIQTNIYDTNFEISTENKVLQKLNAEFQKLRSNYTEQRGIIKLTLDVPKSTALKLTVKYNVLDAGWFPTYDIKTENTTKPLTFHYKANVYQETGSDWENVKITLSTGDPNLNSEKPKVNPYYLNFLNRSNYSNDVKRRLEGKVAGIRVQGVNDSSLNEVEEEVAQAPPMIKTDNITNTLFNIEKPYNITSSKEVTMVEIDNFSIPATYEYYTAPLLSNSVFLTATLKDWENYDFLPGEAKVYFDGNFAGTSYINPLQVEEDFVISLGVDPAIVVERKQVNDLKDKSFFGSTRIVQRNYEISLKNNKTTAVEVQLLDRIPITQNKEIKVEELTYGNADYNDKTGLVKWKVALSPNEQVKKQLSYEVKYPKGKYINLD